MKTVLVNLVHRFVRAFRLEEAVFWASRYWPPAWKLLPPPDFYTGRKSLLVKRDGASFLLRCSDYMQWHVMAGLPDNSWKSAATIIKKSNSETIHVLDVGANCGAFTLKLAAFCYQTRLSNVMIHAFEPNPFMLEALRENISLNPSLKAMIVVHSYGLGSINASLPFAFSDINSGAGRFTSRPSGETELLTIKPLDEVAPQLAEGKLSFLKIDVEGFEPEVLKGAEQTILHEKPVIYIEMTDAWFREQHSSCEQILDYFWALGYKLQIDAETGFIPISASSKSELSLNPQYNILATVDDQS